MPKPSSTLATAQRNLQNAPAALVPYSVSAARPHWCVSPLLMAQQLAGHKYGMRRACPLELRGHCVQVGGPRVRTVRLQPALEAQPPRPGPVTVLCGQAQAQQE